MIIDNEQQPLKVDRSSFTNRNAVAVDPASLPPPYSPRNYDAIPGEPVSPASASNGNERHRGRARARKLRRLARRWKQISFLVLLVVIVCIINTLVLIQLIPGKNKKVCI
jgi:hypothetical protein